MRHLSRSAATLGAAAALVIAGGGAYAVALSTGGTITVCVNHQGGSLYKARSCATHDTKLSWSKVGPQGPQGPTGTTGPQGATGPQGPQGPSDAYYTTGNGGTGIGAQMVTLSVPAGDYAASAIARASTPTAYSNPSLGDCTLFANGDSHYSESKAYIPAQYGSEPGEVMIPAQTVFHLPSGGTIEYSCQGSTTSYANLSETWSDMQITAIQVGTEHG